MSQRMTIVCEGPARERGRAHGAEAAALVHRNVDIYRRVLQLRFRIPWTAARRHARTFVPAITRFDAELAQELQGIAEGARVDLADVVLLNARSSLTLTAPTDGCTTLAFLPGPGEGAEPLLAQNWDNFRGLEAIILKVRRGGCPELLTFTEAGTLAKIGVNAEGIGVAVNGLRAPGRAPRAVPIFVVIRKALQASSLGDAMRVLTATRRDGPHHYLVASQAGAAFSIEALTTDHDIVPATGRFLLHTNHFVAPRFVGRAELPASDAGSCIRLWRAQQLAAQHPGKFDVTAAKELLGDHFSAPTSICAHGPQAADGDLIGETRCAVVMELGVRRLHVSEGHPCRTALETFAFA
jgi:isopenicillin-N N-acyltransferase-like protein